MVKKTLTMDCPDCSKMLSMKILDYVGNDNTFDIESIEGSRFHCADCDKTFYIGETEIVSY